MASNASWLSTKGFSVYNVLHAAWQLQQAPVALSSDQIRTWLQQNWRADVTDEFVAPGVGYLLAKGFVAEADGKLVSTRPGKRLKRINDDVDLDWA